MTRIKCNEIILRSYVAAVAGRGRDELAFSKNQNIKSQQTRKDKAFTFRKARRAREIIVHFTKDAIKNKIKLKSIKKLITTLQNEVEEIR